MNMSMELYYHDTRIASYEQRHWWLTSFNPEYYSVDAADLTAVFNVQFNSSQMYLDFKALNDDWSYNDNTMEASIIF